MKAAIVWLSQTEAQIISFSREKMERIKLLHSVHSEESFFFNQIGIALQGSERLILAGPDVVAHRFLNFLSEHYPQLHRRVVRLEKVDNPDDNLFAHLAQELLAIA